MVSAFLQPPFGRRESRLLSGGGSSQGQFHRLRAAGSRSGHQTWLGDPWTQWVPSGNGQHSHGKSPFLMGKLAIFHSYVKLPEGIWEFHHRTRHSMAAFWHFFGCMADYGCMWFHFRDASHQRDCRTGILDPFKFQKLFQRARKPFPHTFHIHFCLWGAILCIV